MMFYESIPAGAYGSPHAAPVVNRRTLERHPLQCRCEKCEPGSGCACYACAVERVLRRCNPIMMPEGIIVRGEVSSLTRALDSVRSTP